MEVINDILGYKDRKIFQNNDYFCFSIDSVMLANFATIRMKDKNIVDLCTGNGVIPLILTLRTNQKIIGVELQEKLSTLAKKSVYLNNLEDKISIVSMNVKDFADDKNNIEKYDLVTCNPPYFKVNEKSFFKLNLEQKIARHEIELNLAEVFSVSKKILKNGGNLAIVHRPERLIEILLEFKNNCIEPKRIQFVYAKASKEAMLVLIEGQKNGNSGLKIEKPFILYNEDGSLTEEYNKFLTEVR